MPNFSSYNKSFVTVLKSLNKIGHFSVNLWLIYVRGCIEQGIWNGAIHLASLDS